MITLKELQKLLQHMNLKAIQREAGIRTYFQLQKIKNGDFDTVTHDTVLKLDAYFNLRK